jgi:queuine tRNA-ribosyltransferase
MAIAASWMSDMAEFGFSVLATDAGARRGRVTTAHGTVETPAFMPVGTVGSVKGMLPQAVAETGAEILLGNTYHLMLRPTAERVERLGGLHKMMGWDKPILTDSGGFQVMSLTGLRKLTEDAVIFRSHIDGSEHRLSPERSMDIQRMLDSDITMALDECTPHPATYEQTDQSLGLSMRWAARSKAAFRQRPGYGLFGIVQGGIYLDLRSRSVAMLTEIGFHGYAVGGLAVGEGQETMFAVLDHTTPQLPADKPRYLMGVGTPSDLVGAVARGVDMFDCVMPTRSGRTGQAFTARGKVNLRNARHLDDPRPLEEGCRCPACTQFSRAYLHHLQRSEEMLGPILLTWHNLTYYQDLMAGIRRAVASGTFADFAAEFHATWALGDIPPL